MKLVVIAIASLLFFKKASVPFEKWVIEKNSSIRIEGKTNVSGFTCDIVEYLNRDTIFLYKNQLSDQKPLTVKGALTLNINHFDCHQNYVTSDLKKTLKADENPYMKIHLLTLGCIKPNTSNQVVKGYVEIQLAGVNRKMEVDYAVVKNQTGYLHLTGTKKMLFSDFKLTPPKKLAGLIRVEQEIKVQFQLVLRSVAAKPL